MKKFDHSEFFQVLSSLRRGLLQILLTILLVGIGLFPFSKKVLHHLQKTSLRTELVAFSLPEAFLSILKLTLYGSLFFSLPIIFYQIWKAFFPFFQLKGKKSFFSILLLSLFLFYLGAFFCYFVTLPFGVQFLLGYQSESVRPMISAGRFVSFCMAFIFGFGLTFELPLILALLASIRMIRASFLTRNRRYAILFIAILSAVITPTPDIFNMSLMGGPLYILFEIGILLVKMIEKRRGREGVPDS